MFCQNLAFCRKLKFQINFYNFWIKKLLKITSSLVVLEFSVVSNSIGSILVPTMSWAWVGFVGSVTCHAAGRLRVLRFLRVINNDNRCGGRFALRPRNLNDPLTSTTYHIKFWKWVGPIRMPYLKWKFWKQKLEITEEMEISEKWKFQKKILTK